MMNLSRYEIIKETQKGVSRYLPIMWYKGIGPPGFENGYEALSFRTVTINGEDVRLPRYLDSYEKALDIIRKQVKVEKEFIKNEPVVEYLKIAVDSLSE